MITLQQQPEDKPVSNQEQGDYESGYEVCGTQLTRRETNRITLIESIEVEKVEVGSETE